MAKFLLLHTLDPRIAKSEAQMSVMKALVGSFTSNTYAIASWMAVGAGKIACLWEAPSEQAIIDVFPKEANIPVDGIYPAAVIDWAEVKKMVTGR